MRIFIDMDEVMADAYNAHIEWYNKEFNENLTRAECMGKEVIDCVPNERRQSVWNHLFTDGFFRNLRPFEAALEVIPQLQEVHEVYVASAATQFPNSLREKSDWLDEHFPFIPWQNRILCGHKFILRGDVLIDDRGHNLAKFKGRGILFTSPHNIHENRFERADDWYGAKRLLL